MLQLQLFEIPEVINKSLNSENYLSIFRIILNKFANIKDKSQNEHQLFKVIIQSFMRKYILEGENTYWILYEIEKLDDFLKEYIHKELLLCVRKMIWKSLSVHKNILDFLKVIYFQIDI